LGFEAQNPTARLGPTFRTLPEILGWAGRQAWGLPRLQSARPSYEERERNERRLFRLFFRILTLKKSRTASPVLPRGTTVRFPKGKWHLLCCSMPNLRVGGDASLKESLEKSKFLVGKKLDIKKSLCVAAPVFGSGGRLEPYWGARALDLPKCADCTRQKRRHFEKRLQFLGIAIQQVRFSRFRRALRSRARFAQPPFECPRGNGTRSFELCQTHSPKIISFCKKNTTLDRNLRFLKLHFRSKVARGGPTLATHSW
jgi:hypothetical protein